MDKHIVRITGWTAGDRLTFFFAGDLFDSPWALNGFCSVGVLTRFAWGCPLIETPTQLPSLAPIPSHHIPSPNFYLLILAILKHPHMLIWIQQPAQPPVRQGPVAVELGVRQDKYKVDLIWFKGISWHLLGFEGIYWDSIQNLIWVMGYFRNLMGFSELHILFFLIVVIYIMRFTEV